MPPEPPDPPDPPEPPEPPDDLLLLRLLDETPAHADSAAMHVAWESYRFSVMQIRWLPGLGIPQKMLFGGGMFGSGKANVLPQQYCGAGALLLDALLALLL